MLLLNEYYLSYINWENKHTQIECGCEWSRLYYTYTRSKQDSKREQQHLGVGGSFKQAYPGLWP